MRTSRPHRLVHLELHTHDLPLAGEFHRELLGWRPERIDTAHGSYTALGLGGAVGGGIVECKTPRAIWLPYVEVPDIGQRDRTGERARRICAARAARRPGGMAQRRRDAGGR
jgi:predicted enzyme related to lactoylglutathione lyase